MLAARLAIIFRRIKAIRIYKRLVFMRATAFAYKKSHLCHALDERLLTIRSRLIKAFHHRLVIGRSHLARNESQDGVIDFGPRSLDGTDSPSTHRAIHAFEFDRMKH